MNMLKEIQFESLVLFQISQLSDFQCASVIESQVDVQVLPSVPEERESSEPLWFQEIESNEDTDDGTSKVFGLAGKPLRVSRPVLVCLPVLPAVHGIQLIKWAFFFKDYVSEICQSVCDDRFH